MLLDYFLEGIRSERLFYRHLAKEDATENYLSWFDDCQVKEFIEGSSRFNKKKHLEDYIAEHNQKQDSILIGIFNLENKHIGNLKFGPIDFHLKSAWLGILIGNDHDRSRGYGGEAINFLCKFFSRINIFDTCFLGVNKKNLLAINSYKRNKFKIDREENDSFIMVRRN